jgi:hypothetical protein
MHTACGDVFAKILRAFVLFGLCKPCLCLSIYSYWFSKFVFEVVFSSSFFLLLLLFLYVFICVLYFLLLPLFLP